MHMYVSIAVAYLTSLQYAKALQLIYYISVIKVAY
jgi:hypothetical protein